MTIDKELSKVEIAWLHVGRCPDCKGELFITARGGEAVNVSCSAGHKFYIPPSPFTPERLTPKPKMKGE